MVKKNSLQGKIRGFETSLKIGKIREDQKFKFYSITASVFCILACYMRNPFGHFYFFNGSAHTKLVDKMTKLVSLQ